MQRPRDQPMAASVELLYSKWRSGSNSSTSITRRIGLSGPMAWSGTAVCYWLALYTQTRMLFTNSTHVLS
jgi:hypothetical protein